MSLTYDPTAIRYASTQEAYGQTWILNKVEDDGAQVWRNSKGQEAIVPKMCTKFEPALKINFTPEEKLAILKAEGFSVCGNLTSFFPMNEEFRKQMTEGTWENLEPNDYGHFQSDPPYVPKPKLFTTIANSDSSGKIVGGCSYDRVLTREEMAKVRKEGYSAVPGGKPLVEHADSGRVSSTKPNESNKPKSRHGIFAGETYPKRKSCSKPVEGDRSVSEGDRYLYEYHLNEWWVIGKDGVQLQKPEPVSSYSFSNSRYPKVGDKKLAVDGKTVIRWDGQKWRNTTSLSVDEVQVAGDSLGVTEEVKAFKSDAYDDHIKNVIEAKIASRDLGNVTVSDTEIFNLLTKVYK